MIRFTMWMSEAERAELHDMAQRHGTSDNFMLRMALRHFLGYEIPRVLISEGEDIPNDPLLAAD